MICEEARKKADARREKAVERSAEIIFAQAHNICPKDASDLIERWFGTVLVCPKCGARYPARIPDYYP